MSIVQVIAVCSSPKAKTLSKPEPVQTGIKVCPKGIPVWTGLTVVQFTNYAQFYYILQHVQGQSILLKFNSKSVPW